MDKSYQAWGESKEGMLGLITEAPTEAECKNKAVKFLNDPELVLDKPVKIYICFVTPISLMDLAPKWEKVSFQIS